MDCIPKTKHQLSFSCFICLAHIEGGYHNLTRHFSLFHGMLRTTGVSKQMLYCGNQELKKGFDDFKAYREHVLFCEIVRENFEVIREVEIEPLSSAATSDGSDLQPLPLPNEDMPTVAREPNVAPTDNTLPDTPSKIPPLDCLARFFGSESETQRHPFCNRFYCE